MWKYLNSTAACLMLAAPAVAGDYGLGRPALPEEVAAWDLDVSPDGTGLPEGRGDVATGEQVFVDYCASCHGDFAEGVGNWPVLAGGFDTLDDDDPVKTVGSYWPHLSTVWDYVHRSMPFGGAQVLSADEVYAITAYILYSNFLVEDDFELSHENFTQVEMPNAGNFIVDDRPEAEYDQWRTEPCMADCKDTVEITMRASVLDVTPDTGTEEEAAAEDSGTQAEPSVETAALDPGLVAEGEKVFKQCQACHMVGDGAKNRSGPVLNGVMGATIGANPDFRYSNVFKAAAEEGRVWDEAAMAEFLAKPRAYMQGTRMGFGGLSDASDIDAVIAYLKSFDG